MDSKGKIYQLANNPSGLAFRKSALQGKKLTNKMFVEAPQLVHDVIKDGYFYHILQYDAVAVRVHKSTARSKDYYRKMWTSSPVEEWAKLGWKTDDFTHLIQVANYSTREAVLNEIMAFMRINPFYILNPVFVFFSFISICTPRAILLWIPDAYRRTWGRWVTREVKR